MQGQKTLIVTPNALMLNLQYDAKLQINLREEQQSLLPILISGIERLKRTVVKIGGKERQR